MGIPVTNILDKPVVFEGVEGLDNQEIRETKVDELNFKDTNGVVDTFGHGALTVEG